jgi:hypothetical protein
MRLCYECCFPRRFSRFLDWHSDGTITGSIRPRIPLMFLEVAEWDTIYDELAMTIGAPIEHIVVEAQKYIGKDLYDMVKAIYWGIDARRVPNVRWLRPQWLARLLVWGMGDDMAGLGAGRARVESYLAGDHLTVRLINPCVVPMTLGSTQGIYESVEQMPGSKVGYRYEGEDLIVHLTHAEERPESEDRLYLEEGVAGSGPLEYERCSTCGTPIKASRRLSWALRRGETLPCASSNASWARKSSRCCTARRSGTPPRGSRILSRAGHRSLPISGPGCFRTWRSWAWAILMSSTRAIPRSRC